MKELLKTKFDPHSKINLNFLNNYVIANNESSLRNEISLLILVVSFNQIKLLIFLLNIVKWTKKELKEVLEIAPTKELKTILRKQLFKYSFLFKYCCCFNFYV